MSDSQRLGSRIRLAIATFVLLIISRPLVAQSEPSPSSGFWTDGATQDSLAFGKAVLLPNSGKVFLAKAEGARTFAELFDPKTGTWSRLPDLNQSRALLNAATVLNATLLSKDRVLVQTDCDRLLAGGNPAGLWKLYDPAADPPWRELVDPLLLRQIGTTVASLPDGRALVVGGGHHCQTGGANTAPASQEAEIFDPDGGNGGSWTITSSPINPRYDANALTLKDGRILVVGGSPTSGQTAEIFNPSLGAWTALPPSPRFLYGGSHRLSLLQDGKVLVSGGSLPPSPENGAEILDPVLGLWAPAGPNPFDCRCYLHSATTLNNGKVLIAGGDFRSGTYQGAKTYKLFDPVKNEWLEGEPGKIDVFLHQGLSLSGSLAQCGTNCGKVLIPSPPQASKLYTPVPEIIGLMPIQGSTRGGTDIEVRGSGLASAVSVTLDPLGQNAVIACGDTGSGTSCERDAQDPDTKLHIKSPPHAAGQIHIRVTARADMSNPATELISELTPKDIFTYIEDLPIPRLIGIDPECGPTSGGTQVRISGSGLTGATSVKFGGSSVPSNTFNVVSDAEISVTSPASAEGVANLTISTPGGVTQENVPFTYPCPPSSGQFKLEGPPPAAAPGQASVVPTGPSGGSPKGIGFPPGTGPALPAPAPAPGPGPAPAANPGPNPGPFSGVIASSVSPASAFVAGSELASPGGSVAGAIVPVATSEPAIRYGMVGLAGRHGLGIGLSGILLFLAYILQAFQTRSSACGRQVRPAPRTA